MSVGSRLVLLFVALVAGAGAAHAQSYTAEQQSLCTGDAFRLCSSDIPDVDRVTACMVQKRALLSPGCAQFFRGPVARPVPASLRKPASKARKVKKPARTS